MEALIQDVKHALRSFRDSPAFTVTAILALAIGIGANTAIFSVVDAVLLKPASFPEPDKLLLLIQPGRGRPYEPVLSSASAVKFAYLREQTDVIEDVAAYHTILLNWSDGDVLDRVSAIQASEAYFRTFRASFERGRPFSAEDDAPGAPKTVVISHGFWTRRLAEDPDVLGRTLSLSGVPYTIVGVMAPDFGRRELGDVDVWVPYQLGPAPTESTRSSRWRRGSSPAFRSSKRGSGSPLRRLPSTSFIRTRSPPRRFSASTFRGWRRRVADADRALGFVGHGGGLAAAFLLSKLLASILFGVDPRDAAAFVTVPVVLALVAVAAVLIPAYRASRVDPLVALRHD